MKNKIILLILFTVNCFAKVDYKSLELFNKALEVVKKNYYKEVSTEELVHHAIKGMLSGLDPHSSFLDEELFEKMKEDTQGEFGGVGIEVSFKDGMLHIISAIDDTPAYNLIKAGDKIVEINKENAVGLSLQEAVKKMKGKVGEVLELGIERKGENEILKFALKREIIKVKPVKSVMLQNVSYIRLSQFQSDSGKYVSDALKALKKKNSKINGIILDLRDNPGGLLSEAVAVSSIFLNKGVVVSTESRDPKIKDIRYVQKSSYKDLDSKLIVLINKGSASASEIVSGAIQDYKRGTIMGETSYGKGTVQSLTPIDEKSALKLTISQYLTPKKRKIHDIGIIPELEVKESSKRVTIEKDPVVIAALAKIKELLEN
jgi:carboxyl-terminal processing protease